MGKGRAPCCDKSKVRRGAWTPAEDCILTTFIQKHGHLNWRSLPKQAGLLRCGKSCRLRWINYLRPDLRRGNFTQEEEETIIKLHHSLGNKWAGIASHLPGRTDNEIKNVWNTHLKKKIAKEEANCDSNPKKKISEISSFKFSSNSSLSSTNTTSSSQSSNYFNSIQVSWSIQNQEDGVLFNNQNVNFGDYDIDYWGLLNNLEPQNFEASQNSKVGEENVDREGIDHLDKWLRELENELGLEATE